MRRYYLILCLKRFNGRIPGLRARQLIHHNCSTGMHSPLWWLVCSGGGGGGITQLLEHARTKSWKNAWAAVPLLAAKVIFFLQVHPNWRLPVLPTMGFGPDWVLDDVKTCLAPSVVRVNCHNIAGELPGHTFEVDG